MTTLVSIDGGKSGLRVRVAGDGGIGEAEGPGFTYGPGEEDIRSFTHAVRTAVRPLNLPPRVDGVCAGLTGVPGDAAMRRRLNDELAALLCGPVLLVPDAVPAHAGALASAGTVVCAGTGTTVLALRHDGHYAQVDGWGPLIGDRGSGYELGRAGVRAAAAALDSTGPPSALVEAFVAELGGTSLRRVQDFYRAEGLVARTAAFAVQVVAAADAGDSVSAELCRATAHALAASVAAARRRAGLGEDETLVSYSGRLLGLGPALATPFRDAVEAQGLTVVPPRDGPLAGGIRLLEADGDVYARLIDGWKDGREC
jgi:glucosamine kinase